MILSIHHGNSTRFTQISVVKSSKRLEGTAVMDQQEADSEYSQDFCFQPG